MLRQKFDQQWSVRKTEVTEEEHSRILRLIKPANLTIDARLEGPTIAVEDMMRLECGDVLTFDFGADKPLYMLVNGKLKFRGQIVASGRKKAFAIQHAYNVTD